MPVALRKRSWEDHVTPHWGTRYSYDDLDLICWHGVVDGGGPSTGPRERCASMPECRRRRPAVGSRTEAGGDDDEGAVGDNGSWRERTFSCGLTGTTGQSGNKETGNVSGAESLPTMTDQDMHQSAESSAGHGSVGSLSASTSNDIPGEGHRNGTEMEDEWPFPDTLPTSEPSSPNVEGCGTDGTRPDIGSADRAEASGTEPIPEESVVIRAQGSPETKLTKLGDSEDDHVGGPVDAAGADADLTGEDRSSEHLDPSQVSKTSVAPDVSFPNPAAQSSGVACHSRNVDRLDAGGPLAKTRDFGASSDHEAPPCLSGSDPKLNPILEISLTESEEEAPGHVMAVAFLEPEGIRNGAAAMHTPQGSSGLLAEQGLLGNSQNNKVAELTPVWESLLDCASETVQSDAPGHQATPNMDRSDEVERNKPQESPVRLWARKSSREEREMARCRLDSMVLLIMKLDQLDQEIESALSSAPSHDGTPTLKRRIISQADVASLDGDGSPSGSAHSLNTHHHHHHQPSSSQSSTELGGAKPGMATCAAFSRTDRAETEAKEACSWLRAAGFPQYAQLYEDGEFPIEIPSVTRDHDFLDRDAIEALCRRLNTLNKCALMRLEITPQRKRSEDSDEDEPCAISGRWTFQRESKRWSRLDLDVFYPPAGGAAPDQECLVRDGLGTSAESVLTDVSECPDGGSSRGGGSRSAPPPPAQRPVSALRGRRTAPPSPPALGHFPFEAGSVPAGGGGAKSTRSRAKSFLKRMESLRLRSSSGVAGAGRRRRTGLAGAGRPEISAPEPKEGLDEDALRRFNCVDIEGQGRATCYSTQTSSGSAGSSQSETSSGSAVSTPSPVSRARSHSAAAGAAKRAGMYLEGFDPFSLVLVQEGVGLDNRRRGRRAEPSTTAENNQRNLCWPDEQQGVDEAQGQGQEGRVIYFYLPEGHKPGTFPKALADSGPCCRGDGTDYRVPRRVSSTSLDSRLSFYDNVPFPEMGGEEEEEEEEEPQGVGEEPKIGEVLDRGRGLRQLVSAWSSRGREEEDEEGDSDSALDSASPCPSSPLQNRLEEENASDPESTGNATRDRRDSGMGPSLTLNNRPQKLRWPSFQSSHRPSGSSSHLQVGCQSVQQMNLLRKYSLLKITALLEKHTPASKHGFSWAVPKFMKRMKVRDMRGRSVFGVPLQVNVQRSGQPLPQGIQHAMRYLRQQCLDQVGLFRKSGVKSRIQALRQMNESCGTDGGGVSYEGQSAYDVADMLKQYFRDLPEPLLTSKLSDTFLQIYQFVPKELRLQAVRAAVLLLPDDKREVLQTLLCFLGDVTANASENQMTCTNLAVCLAPSLFHLNTARRDASSPRVMSRKNALGKPDQKDLNENLAATHCLAHMIQECRKLFQIPEELSCCRKSYMEQSLSPCRMEDLLEVHGSRGYRGLVQESLDALLKEAKDRFRGYDSCSTHEHAIELAYKKVHDGWSLRQWKVCTEVGAGPEDVLRRIAGEQSSWDEDLLESRVVESLEHSADVYQYVRNSMAPHPPMDHVVLRLWVTDLAKGACALVCVSVDHEGAAVLGVRANVLTSRYYIEPCGPNKSRITHISRIDYRGRCPEWYNKMYGHLCASELVRIRDSFICPLDK
ncbi:LOW QUALITY PROTEIN: rho GTPase-activating protein 7 [Electrophorus electricus]|uniref:LOW QUALITY PROTEIN: rho GTPase-activating protein 7 n=1 Tax=Electrophorus electricus TaxID=8005 RepID=UPI0015CFC1D3|nr:LOW QUALITY PROTEIN: rho GTPase-activating protein 7 [Electrophorus electricus]